VLAPLPPATGEELTPVPNGVDENIPAGLRLAGAWSWRLLVIAAAIALVMFLVVQLRFIVIPLLVAVLVSALLVPFISLLTRHRWPKGLAVVAALIGTLAVVGGLVTLAVTQIAAGSSDLSTRFAASYAELTQALAASPLDLDQAELNTFVSDAVSSIQADSQIFITGALSVGSSIGHLAAGILLALFSLLFILIDGKSIWKWIVRIFPRRARAAVDGAGTAGWTTLVNFARVQILVASIDAIGIGAGAAILGVPMAIPIGVLVFLGSFIPIVGAVATGAVAVLIALVFNDWFVAVLMLAVVLLVQQIEGHILQPLIMGTAVKVHPLGVVLVVAAGALLAGIPGALFAVPVAAVLNVMISYIHSGAWRGDLPPLDTPPGSVLWQTIPQRPRFRPQQRLLSPADSASVRKTGS
jgi:predicted PurR-regulated permease PerM